MLNNSEAYQQALDLFTESVIKPDYELRANASYAGCYFELMEIRQHCLAYLKTLKEIHQIETGDESDAIEAEKIIDDENGIAKNRLLSWRVHVAQVSSRQSSGTPNPSLGTRLERSSGCTRNELSP